MSNLPKSVTINDDTMREGLQIESAKIPVEAKLRLLDALGETGAKVISIGSFAHPKWTPQMACIDELASRFVPKPRYGYVRAGWQACVAAGLPAPVAPPADSNASRWARHLRTAYDDVARLIQSPDSDLGLWLVLLALIAIATHSADHYFRDREQVLKTMQRFSQKFVREFEGPLAAGDLSVRPIQSKLRFAPHASRLDILIAPGAGRRYPNLADHRNNVDYDLRRVLDLLRDEPFVNGRPYMDGRWVVLPFSLKPAIRQAGDR